MAFYQEMWCSWNSNPIQSSIGSSRFLIDSRHWLSWDFLTYIENHILSSLTCNDIIPQFGSTSCRYRNNVSSWRFRRNYLHGTTQNDGKWQVSWKCMQATQATIWIKTISKTMVCQASHKFLLNANFTRLYSEPNLYVRNTKLEFTILEVYVDDLPIARTSKKEILEVIKELQRHFQSNVLGHWSIFLEYMYRGIRA